MRVEIGLPARFAVLAEPAESLLVLDCAAGQGRVLWCDASDAVRLGKSPLIRAPEEWASYADFFASLLDEEEGERA